MRRFATILVIGCWSVSAPGHHTVIGIYDDQRRFTIEVEVREFELIDPHPLIFVEITAIPEGQEADGISIGQTWTLEMDNRRELTALGFAPDTFVQGDHLIVAVDPARHTRYRENTLYLRAAEHPREGFVYLHNVRQLFPIESDGETLSKHLHMVN